MSVMSGAPMRRLFVSLAFAVATFAGCPGPSTTLTNMWRDPDYSRGSMHSVYDSTYHQIYEPGYVETEQVVRHEIDVYSTGSRGALVWTGTSESVDPASRDQVRQKVATKVVAELVSSGVLTTRG